MDTVIILIIVGAIWLINPNYSKNNLLLVIIMLQHFVEGKWKENILDKYKIFFFINLNMTTASQGVCVANNNYDNNK
jgi:hypothetical protein